MKTYYLEFENETIIKHYKTIYEIDFENNKLIKFI